MSVVQAAIDAELPFLRREAEARMLDTFAVYSPTDDTEADAEGFEVPYYAVEDSVMGRIAGSSAQSRDTNARSVTVGGTERQVVSGGLHIPISAPAPAMGKYGFGWEYVLTTLGPNTPAALLNSRWLVLDTPLKSDQTALRLDVVRLV